MTETSINVPTNRRVDLLQDQLSITTTDADLTPIYASLTTNLGLIGDNTNSITSLRNDLTSNVASITANQGSITQVATDLANNVLSISSLTGDISTINGSLTAHAGSLSSHALTLTAHTGSLSSHNTSILSLSSENATQQTSLGTLSTSVSTLNSRLNTLSYTDINGTLPNSDVAQKALSADKMFYDTGSKSVVGTTTYPTDSVGYELDWQNSNFWDIITGVYTAASMASALNTLIGDPAQITSIAAIQAEQVVQNGRLFDLDAPVSGRVTINENNISTLSSSVGTLETKTTGISRSGTTTTISGDLSLTGQLLNTQYENLEDQVGLLQAKTQDFSFDDLTDITTFNNNIKILGSITNTDFQALQTKTQNLTADATGSTLSGTLSVAGSITNTGIQALEQKTTAISYDSTLSKTTFANNTELGESTALSMIINGVPFSTAYSEAHQAYERTTDQSYVSGTTTFANDVVISGSITNTGIQDLETATRYISSPTTNQTTITGLVSMGEASASSMVIDGVSFATIENRTNDQTYASLTTTFANKLVAGTISATNWENVPEPTSIQNISSSGLDQTSISGTLTTGTLSCSTGATTGSFGVGTATPIAKLQVDYTEGSLNTISYTNTASWYDKGLRLNGGSGGILYGLDINHSIFLRKTPWNTTGDNNAFCSPGYHAFYTDGFVENQTEKLRITQNGRVGIGVANPSASLHIQSSVNPHILIGNSALGGGIINFGNGAHGVGRATGQSDFTDANDVVLYTSGTTGGSGLKTNGGFLKVSPGGATQISGSILGGTSTDTSRVYSHLSNMNTGDYKFLTFGKANSSRNQGELYYAHTGGDGSTSNFVGLGLHSINVLKAYGDGNIQKPYQSACRVSYNLTYFTLPQGNNTVIKYNYELYDINNDYSIPTGYFTCPWGGRYLAFHVFTGRDTRTTNLIVEAKLYHNGNEVNRQFVGYGYGNYNATASCIINASANDTINAGLYNGDANNQFNGSVEGGGCQFIVYFLG
jgi:hypothetical protein